jgi:hypothetical protein
MIAYNLLVLCMQDDFEPRLVGGDGLKYRSSLPVGGRIVPCLSRGFRAAIVRVALS